jgi:Zn-dependent protease with chaperone function
MSWRGYYHDGRSAERRAATVRLAAETLEIAIDGEAIRRWPLAEVRQTQGSYAGEPVRLERGGSTPEVLVVEETAFLGALGGVTPRRRRFHDPRGRRRRVALTLAAGLGALSLLASFYLWAIPLAAGVATRFVPVGWEVWLGDEVFARLFAPERRCAAPDGQRAIDAIVDRLTAAGGRGPYRLRVTVVDQPTVNALALPGGRVVLLRGLLEATDSPAMLAGVLAHEIQHVVRRHTTRAIIQYASTGLMAAAISGDVSGMVTLALEGARIVAVLGYSRRAEEEADTEGMRMLLAARIDPAPMVAFYERVLQPLDRSQESGFWNYLRTHPTVQTRTAGLRGLAAGAGSHATLLPDVKWAEVKQICSGG